MAQLGTDGPTSRCRHFDDAFSTPPVQPGKLQFPAPVEHRRRLATARKRVGGGDRSLELRTARARQSISPIHEIASCQVRRRAGPLRCRGEALRSLLRWLDRHAVLRLRKKRLRTARCWRRGVREVEPNSRRAVVAFIRFLDPAVYVHSRQTSSTSDLAGQPPGAINSPLATIIAPDRAAIPLTRFPLATTAFDEGDTFDDWKAFGKLSGFEASAGSPVRDSQT